jgi:hypothetical protein
MDMHWTAQQPSRAARSAAACTLFVAAWITHCVDCCAHQVPPSMGELHHDQPWHRRQCRTLSGLLSERRLQPVSRHAAPAQAACSGGCSSCSRQHTGNTKRVVRHVMHFQAPSTMALQHNSTGNSAVAERRDESFVQEGVENRDQPAWRSFPQLLLPLITVAQCPASLIPASP